MSRPTVPVAPGAWRITANPPPTSSPTVPGPEPLGRLSPRCTKADAPAFTRRPQTMTTSSRRRYAAGPPQATGVSSDP
jgi:hypothetical protein